MGTHDGRILICATTFPDRDAAEAVVRGLVADGLVACGQVGADLTSFYRWRGKVQRDGEVAATLKIVDDRLGEALARLRADHPYDIPQILCWRAEIVDDDYGEWAAKEDP